MSDISTEPKREMSALIAALSTLVYNPGPFSANEIAELRIAMRMRIADIEQSVEEAASSGRVSLMSVDLADAKSALAKVSL